ncbi:MAG: hypothetical protein WDM78_11505 [Puia sp.]
MLLEIITITPSPLLISLLIAYFFLACITTWDIRLSQAIKNGEVTPDHPRFGIVMSLIFWIEWGIWFWILILDWKLGLLVWGLKFILKVLPVLEVLGGIIMWPFLRVQIKKYKKDKGL